MIKPLLITGILLLSGTAVTSSTEVETLVSEESISEVVETPEVSEDIILDESLFIEPIIEFTKDSVYTKGIELVPVKVVDFEKKLVDLEIVIDIPHGYDIYDKEDTSYIDGIQINGEWISEYYIRNYDYTKPLTVTIKTIYADDILGTLASMKDGNFDYLQLLSNPVALLMAIYYFISILTLIVSGFGMLRAKKIKVKSSNEIAGAVSEKAEELKANIKVQQEQLANQALNIVKDILEPALLEIKKETQAMLKAVIISNSKTKEAPLVLLDTLEDVATDKISDLIADVKTKISNQLATAETTKQQTLEALNKIAQPTQEVNDGKQEQKEETKSIF